VVALDPGVRTFLTGYTPGGALFEIGPNGMARITSLCFFLDQLQSKIDRTRKARERLRLRKAAMRMRTRIRDMVNDVHKKTACFLAQSFDVVLLPTFNVSNMVQRARRRIRSKTVRQMLTWAHYRFRQTLLARARSTGTHVLLVSEAYTSKTCGKCGQIHAKLGGAKRFRCPQCSHAVDRDANAARNILLRNADFIHLGVVQPSHPRMALPPMASPSQ